jgi:Uma2 family endonuclease
MNMSTAILEPARARPLDDEPLYEIVDGRHVELPPMSFFATLLATRLTVEMGIFLKAHDLGFLAVETLFHLGLPADRNRRPDIAFVSYVRWAKARAKDKSQNVWDVVPDLVVEIVSPNDDATELLEKLAEYFQAGVQLIWVVYPHPAMVYAFRSMTEVQGLTPNDTLAGGKILPAFELPLKNLFVD